MDVTNLILHLKGKITSNSIDQQMVSKAIRLLELGTVFTANSFADLPSPVGRSGQLWLVLFDGLYWSTGELWLPIFQTSQGLAWAWGLNTSGQLGDNSATIKSSPVSVAGNITDWYKVSTACNHTMAIRLNGSAWGWGLNTFGKLGDNTGTTRSSPVSVVGGITNWCQISAGFAHSVALRTSGSAWSWGTNSSGQLGDNTTINTSSPVSVVGGFSDWCQISAGNYHNVAVRIGGSAWAWGFNSTGRLGDNTQITKSSPVSVVGGFSDWCKVTGGGENSAGVRSGGSLWSWGANSSGALGNNATNICTSPVSVVGGFSDWCDVASGCQHMAAVRSVGSAWSWGCATVGSLGDNTTVNKSSPVSVVGGFNNWCAVSANRTHTVAVRTSGSAWAWGCNNCGQLGNNTTTNTSSPVSVLGGFSDWCQTSAGLSNTLAIRSKTL